MANRLLRTYAQSIGFTEAFTVLDRSDAEGFAKDNAWLVFWPYFRQFVSDATARMAVPPEVLPLSLGPGRFSASGSSRRVLGKKRAQKRKAVKPAKA